MQICSAKLGAASRTRAVRRLHRQKKNERVSLRNWLFSRFIPAWAGNTWRRRRGRPRRSVHPRVGGEHIESGLREALAVGSSPRGRGTLRRHDIRGGDRRFIPAWAGNTYFSSLRRTLRSVHPRVGGEHPGFQRNVVRFDGSSPRGRGTLQQMRRRTTKTRFIPAWAGNTATPAWPAMGLTVHPRVGGEHCCTRPAPRARIGSSPRGRGTRGIKQRLGHHGRFIPAWAGNTIDFELSARFGSVHPRVGGEHAARRLAAPRVDGSSPRGRGTPD